MNAVAHQLHGRWVWPLPRYQGRPPVIAHGFDDSQSGVDLMYARQPSDGFRPGTPNGSVRHVMPDDTVALAVSDGTIWSAGTSPTGFAVVIDHGPGQRITTFYAHLEKLLVASKEPGPGGPAVRAGQPLGVVGCHPLDPTRLKHLHFEIWSGLPADAIDPAPLMRSWKVLLDERDMFDARNARRFRPRNALIYRPLGASGEPYPEWVLGLKGKAGVYLIREHGELVYIGSSDGRLYDTLARHFQAWRRVRDARWTYDRASCEVAVRVMSPSEAFDEEMRLNHLLRPRDNAIAELPDDDF
jgi:hypothetical protein